MIQEDEISPPAAVDELPDNDSTGEQTARKRGSGKWGNPAVPRTGWQCQDVIDHLDRDRVCEMCEYQHIRYEHVMTHPGWPAALGCGCVCAGAMCEDIEGARSREREVRNASLRKLREQQRAAKQAELVAANAERTPEQREYRRVMGPVVNWRTSARGNPWAKLGDYRAVVCRNKSRYGYMIAKGDADGVFAKEKFATMDEARNAAWDALLDKQV